MTDDAVNIDTAEAPRGFSRVPHCVLEGIMLSGELSRIEIRVLLSVVRWQYGFHKTCADVSLPELERVTGATRKQIQRALRVLLEDGYLELVRRPVRGRPRQVRIGARLLTDKASPVTPYSDTEDGSLGVMGDACLGVMGDALNAECGVMGDAQQRNLFPNKSDKESIVEFSPSASFDAFWEQLPKGFKKGKDDALKWWHANIRNQAKADVLMAAYQDQERERATYKALGVWTADRKHVVTWLRKKAWEDETLTDDEIRALAASKNGGKNATGTGTASGMVAAIREGESGHFRQVR